MHYVVSLTHTKCLTRVLSDAGSLRVDQFMQRTVGSNYPTTGLHPEQIVTHDSCLYQYKTTTVNATINTLK